MEELLDEAFIDRFIEDDPAGTLILRSLMQTYPGHELFCDNPSDPAYLFGVFEWVVTFHALNETAVDEFILEKPKRGMMFAGIRHKWAEKIRAAEEPKWKSPCRLIWWPEQECNLEYEYPVRPLTFDDIELVNKHWDIGGGNAADYIKERIETGIHVGCDDDEGLVSWALTHGDGSMGFLYTMERGRRKGYARSTGVAHIRRLLEAGQTPFAYILVGNDASLNLAKSLGLKEAGFADYFGYED